MAALIAAAYAAQYALGRGGFGAVTDGDRAALEAEIGAQLDWLDGFAGDLSAADLADMTDEEIAAYEAGVSDRAASYLEGGIGAYELGRAGMWEVDVSGMEIPPVHANCMCSLDFVEEDGQTVVYWITADNPCDVCIDLESQYSPYIPGEG